jgi:glycosyltransferase involved in cell wall biosynthesis
MPPLISICLPCLNARPFLEDRMASILAQTVQDWELVVCDSYSDDGSWEFFQQFTGDSRVRLYQVPRAGLYAGWNECLRRARGEYIHIATADDVEEPRLLESLAGRLEKHSEIDIAYADFAITDEHGKITDENPGKGYRMLAEWMAKPHIRDGRTEFLLNACFSSMWHIMNAVVFRRRLLDKTGFFRTDQGSLADLDWTLRACLATDLIYIPGKLAYWRRHGQQASPNRDQRTPEHAWVTYKSLVQIMHDPSADIPAEWRQVPGWDNVIAKARFAAYFSALHLFRWELKRCPGKFWRGVTTALRHTPGVLIRQLLHGFGQAEYAKVTSQSAFDEVKRALRPPWPPCRDISP